ncbi:MAG: hypothetical protein H8E73_04385 [Planctomycetes bacterium]|nr:hypothetical protein [Planctomycetota bacterium]MBL7187439.1 hypothetical protein [Phycisphaerae bacterium]
MTERMEHFDEDLDLGVSLKLTEDLDALFKPQFSMPPEVDRAILDRARTHFAGRQFTQVGRRGFRWVGLWKVAAAAAVVVLAFSLNLTNKPEPALYRTVLVKAGAVDFDRNGRVDILDAFKLARQIELASNTRTDLDINGDGLINRDDVDVVALAAVSLDKGVL